MSDRERLARLTNLLYGLAAVMFGGTILELLAAGHYQAPVQLLPFALCGVGFVAVLLAWKRPGWATVQARRGLMLVTAVATLLGIWKHLEGNIGFIHEMHPASSRWPLLVAALTGRAPLLASGVLAVAATAAIAATFAAGWSVRGQGVAGTFGDWRTHSTPRTSEKIGRRRHGRHSVRRWRHGGVANGTSSG
jgi:hypothetical protein